MRSFKKKRYNWSLKLLINEPTVNTR